MDVDFRTGLVRPTHKWRQNQEQVSDTLSPKILKYAESGCLYLQDGEMFIWALPERILSAGNSVTVMTYKAEGSITSFCTTPDLLAQLMITYQSCT